MGRRSDGDLIGIIDRARYAQAESIVTHTRRLVGAEAQHGGRWGRACA